MKAYSLQRGIQHKLRKSCRTEMTEIARRMCCAFLSPERDMQNYKRFWWFALLPFLVFLLHAHSRNQSHVEFDVGEFTSYDEAGRAAVQKLSTVLYDDSAAQSIVVRYSIINNSHHLNEPSHGYLEYERQSRYFTECDTSFSSGCIPLPATSEGTIHSLAQKGSVINDLRE